MHYIEHSKYNTAQHNIHILDSYFLKLQFEIGYNVNKHL